VDARGLARVSPTIRLLTRIFEDCANRLHSHLRRLSSWLNYAIIGNVLLIARAGSHSSFSHCIRCISSPFSATTRRAPQQHLPCHGFKQAWMPLWIVAEPHKRTISVEKCGPYLYVMHEQPWSNGVLPWVHLGFTPCGKWRPA